MKQYGIITMKKNLGVKEMKVERVEHVTLNPYESKLLIEFSELMYDIEREVTDERIKSIIADIPEKTPPMPAGMDGMGGMY